MSDPIEVCMGFVNNIVNSGSTTSTTTFKPPSWSEYLASLQSLTVIDIFLGIFLVCIVISLLMSGYLKERTASVVLLAFLGILTFLTIKQTNQKLLADMCMTCQGLNKIKHETKLDVVMSFAWLTIQTFLALLLNVMYYFIVLVIMYLLYRSHLIYSFGTLNVYANELGEKDYRWLSAIHGWLQKPIQFELTIGGVVRPILQIIYWPVICIIIIVLAAVIAVSFVNPTMLATQMGAIGKGISVLALPFVIIAVALLYNKIDGTRQLSKMIDKQIAHKVIPIFHYRTLTKGFNFAEADKLKAHAFVFVNAIIYAVLYALVFIKPIKKEEICVPDVNNTSPAFLEFKNRFVMGHYIVGAIIILTYVATLGKEIGQAGILVVVALFVAVYVIAYFGLDGGTASHTNTAPLACEY